MKLSQKGLNLLKKHEGFRSKPYLCPANIPTIGYGNTFYPDGSKVTMNDKELTSEEANELLSLIVKKFELGVAKLIKSSVNQNQFDATVSFAYNLGLGALSRSTLLKKINLNPSDPTLKKEFNKWNKANGVVLRGLVKRRAEEADLYFS